MTKIGSFRKVSGEYHGEIVTLAIQSKSVQIVSDPAATGNEPSHRVLIDDFEIGAAWPKRTRDERPYLSVKLDDPSFVAPIYARLYHLGEDEYELLWSRSSRRSAE